MREKNHRLKKIAPNSNMKMLCLPFMDDEKSALFNSFDVIFNINVVSKLFQFSPPTHNTQGSNQIQYSFFLLYLIISDCTFNVEIIKGPRGLGLSVSGGIDSSAPYPGLVRIKRLFPHQAAWATGKLQPGDILLEANGIILTGLTNNVS